MSSSPSTAELTNSLTSKMITKELASYRTTICATIFSNKILLVITQTNAFGSIYHCLNDMQAGLRSINEECFETKCLLGFRDDHGLSETVCEQISVKVKQRTKTRKSIVCCLAVKKEFLSEFENARELVECASQFASECESEDRERMNE
jgi:hypothetical protein